ncbi:hypothetical protein [Sphingomonas sediminicola]|nr:hypothetical protein ['Sphingomonas ginsengisoli' Hoang et al. 2012]
MRITVTLALLALSCGSAAMAKDAPAESSALRGLARCKAIGDSAARLACFDQEAATLLAAEQRSDIVIVAREQVERNRRAMFGFNMPDVGVLRDHGGKVETLDQVEGVLAEASADASGQWVFTLRDGSVWEQTDMNPQTWSPRAGDPVLIKRAGLGGFRLSVAKAPGVRVRRVR